MRYLSNVQYKQYKCAVSVIIDDRGNVNYVGRVTGAPRDLGYITFGITMDLIVTLYFDGTEFRDVASEFEAFVTYQESLDNTGYTCAEHAEYDRIHAANKN